MNPCRLCPRQCSIDREASGGAGGFCGMPVSPVLAYAGVHFWEEPCVSGKDGSGTVFFSGCNLKCVYCQNEKISLKGFASGIEDGYLQELSSAKKEYIPDFDLSGI